MDKIIPFSSRRTVRDNSELFRIRFSKDLVFFKCNNEQEYKKYINHIKRNVRQSEMYKEYIAYLKGEIRLNKCSLLATVDDNTATIEMHHGPIYSLHDICEIVLAHELRMGRSVDTFSIATLILKAHYDNAIQLVPVSQTVHQLVHAHKLFIPLESAFGNLEEFRNRFHSGFNNRMLLKYNRYMDRYKKFKNNPDNLDRLFHVTEGSAKLYGYYTQEETDQLDQTETEDPKNKTQ